MISETGDLSLLLEDTDDDDSRTAINDNDSRTTINDDSRTTINDDSRTTINDDSRTTINDDSRTTTNDDSRIAQADEASSVGRRLLLELCVAAAVVTFMVVGTFIGTQLQTRFDYRKPVFLTWFGASFLVTLLLLQFVATLLHYVVAQRRAANLCQLLAAGCWQFVEQIRATSGGSDESALRSAARLFAQACGFSVLWMGANLLFSTAQGYTTPSSLLSLEQAATVFVYLLSVWLLAEKATYPKVMSVCVCIGGVLIITFAGGDSGGTASGLSQLLGDVLVVASTLCTALYLVLFKKLLDFPLNLFILNCFLGFIGLAVLLLWWPLLLVADATGWESFEWPSGAAVQGLFWASTVDGLLFNYALNLGVIYVSPLFMRIAVLCTIPVSFLLDYFAFSAAVNLVQVAGALFIVAGFLAFVYFNSVPTAHRPRWLTVAHWCN